MIDVVGVCFSKKGRMYYFAKNNLEIDVDDEVIVETERGLQYGFVVKENKININQLVSPLKNVVRVATSSDKKIYYKLIKENSVALDKCRRLVIELNLPMNIIDASYTFDKKQLLYNFTADDRIDFRELAKKLAAIYKTRIELRQIGIRDKAREVGGIGPCGRFLCCNSFLKDLNSVTINMAKNQLLALNPTKINGVCGRLLCCLAYEDETYTSLKKGLPNIGEKYKYNGKFYKVIDLDIYSRKVLLEDEEHNQEEVIINESSK